jgi:hypothetical protein
MSAELLEAAAAFKDKNRYLEEESSDSSEDGELRVERAARSRAVVRVRVLAAEIYFRSYSY